MAENESILENKMIHELATGDSQWTYRPDLKTKMIFGITSEKSLAI